MLRNRKITGEINMNNKYTRSNWKTEKHEQKTRKQKQVWDAVTTRTVQLLFQHGVGLGYYSNMATGSVTVPRWRRASSGALVRADWLRTVSTPEWVSEWYICILKTPQETRFYASRNHEFKKETKPTSAANYAVNKLILDRGSCEKLQKKFRFPDPVHCLIVVVQL